MLQNGFFVGTKAIIFGTSFGNKIDPGSSGNGRRLVSKRW